MQIDPWILTFSAITVILTIGMGFWTARRSKTASDFFVAGRSVSVGWNASAISGEYLSAASFMGVAGMVMSSGYDALWYPVCYACGYLFLLLFIAGPLRRFGAYTIPDFAEGRFDSPLFRKIAVCFVLFIGFFYTMPQMKGAGTTLAYIFPGLPYWAGVVLVGAVITLNVALGGMKGITLVQAFQYWAKMFAISVPIFVLMAVYGHYGKQLGVNQLHGKESPLPAPTQVKLNPVNFPGEFQIETVQNIHKSKLAEAKADIVRLGLLPVSPSPATILSHTTMALSDYAKVLPGLGDQYTNFIEQVVLHAKLKALDLSKVPPPTGQTLPGAYRRYLDSLFATNGLTVLEVGQDGVALIMTTNLARFTAASAMIEAAGFTASDRKPLPTKAPTDSTWLSPFGPLTTKAAKVAARAVGRPSLGEAMTNVHPRFRLYLPPYELSSYKLSGVARTNRIASQGKLLPSIERLIGIDGKANLLFPGQTNMSVDLAFQFIAHMNDWEILLIEDWDAERVTPPVAAGYRGPVMRGLMKALKSNGIQFRHLDGNRYLPVRRARTEEYTPVVKLLKAMTAENVTPEAWLAKHEKPLALLYTYSLIIALVCGTAGLPHILVRFYTNPDGVAAKRTTMWVMILIGIFYVFPPVFGVMGRNLLPELYAGVGAKGTDKVVLELPRILNDKGSAPASGAAVSALADGRGATARDGANVGDRASAADGASAGAPGAGALPAKRKVPWGSILSGITCAGAFAAFMSTFSGLLVSMTGALAHDVYGRMLRPKSTPEQRMRMFRLGAVLLGGGAIIAGSFVEPLQINFMVGQAFAIAAASYFPLLFMSAWWRGMTMKGAATGMLTGGLLALTGISLTSFSDLALATDRTAQFFAIFKPLNDFWAQYPLLRILCEQPAIWTVPLAIALMVIVSKLTRTEVPSDIRMKMLVLHAPEKLGLKQEYIQEHQHGH